MSILSHFPVEVVVKEGKEQLGMADYEVRSCPWLAKDGTAICH
jgi:hypothetical protein